MRPDPVTAGPTGVTRFVTGDYGSPGSPDGLWSGTSSAVSPSVPAATSFDIETADRLDAVDAASWDAAVDALGLPVFYSRTFLAAYERHPLTAVDGVVYVLVRRGPGPPVAVLPAYLQHRPDPIGHLAGPFPSVAAGPALLAHCWHCYDGDLGAAAPAVVAALRDVARSAGVPWCGLLNVRRDGGTARALAGAGLPLRPLTERYGAALAGISGFDDFVTRNVGQKARANLRRHRRRALEHGVRTAVLPVAEADLTGISELCNRLAGRHTGADRYYPPGRFERFLAALGPAALAIEIRQHGRLVAGGICLLDATRLHWWAGGADYEVPGNYSPYYVMFAEVVELALRLGKPDLEGGRGNPAFKLRHGLHARPLDACIVPALPA